MKIYKFGGASVKDAEGVKNLFRIVNECTDPLVVVVSAMGKTTNLLEEIHSAYVQRKQFQPLVDQLLEFHNALVDHLMDDVNHPFLKLHKWFQELIVMELGKEPSLNHDFDYDRIVSFGELFSTSIISAYFHSQNKFHQWLDARKVVRTTNDYREGKINWNLTKELIQYNVQPRSCPLYITQGFLGSTETNQVVTLGREGSDFSAAIFANALMAENMTIWKDVPGIMNADPGWYANAVLIEEMTYKEAVEMSYFGANVIHPKTLKPLQNEKIPLYVRSFSTPGDNGTVIKELKQTSAPLPVLIRKNSQALITVSPKDFSFMMEENLKAVFEAFEKFRIKVNIMEKAALSFTACISYQNAKLTEVVDLLRESFSVKYNTELQLLTIRHYNQKLLDEFTGDKSILMEQRNRDTAWFVYKSVQEDSN